MTVDGLGVVSEAVPSSRIVVVDGERCTGQGRCYTLSPEAFDADDEGRGFALHPHFGDELQRAVEGGVANCPERAITVHQ